MRISDWSSDVCSSDLTAGDRVAADRRTGRVARARRRDVVETGRNDVTRKRGAQHVVDLDVIIIKRQVEARQEVRLEHHAERPGIGRFGLQVQVTARGDVRLCRGRIGDDRSEEHTSELQSLMRNSYAVFCLKKKKNTTRKKIKTK